ncbi:MAG: hypothetical protein H7Z12_19880 [Rhodospirillaceae bacterium]|nr:hypothetical protein [Rhodospirillales bacterium]
MNYLLQDCGVDAFDDYSLTLCVGASTWSDHKPDDADLRDCPMICVSTATNADWQAGDHGDKETWIYFYDRRSWRGAHRLARVMLRGHGVASIPKTFGADLGGFSTDAIVGASHQLDIY